MNQWQPIDSAPHDTEVLLWGPGWQNACSGMVAEDGFAHNPNDGAELTPAPTVWMHLPPPPSLSKTISPTTETSMSIQLGSTYKDKITGFQGVATGFVQYISGCNQALIAPRVGPDGGGKDSQWFDQQRLELVDVERVVLENGATPGHDKSAPKR